MKSGPEVFLRDILESIALIEHYVAGSNRDSFLEDRQLQDSVVRRFEIIGEAVKNLPRMLRDQYAGVPWKRLAGLRDVLIHRYSGVDEELVWKMIGQDLPGLKVSVQNILAALDK